ncbi:MAG: tyrosine-type recombinase/integrase [Candidatus Sericytochromatia bacterium]|nr:tyrosine-type recombinase/integrase [Candidatus Sericytochromatia bacterium]
MIVKNTSPQSTLTDAIAQFIANGRALGKRFRTEEEHLRLLERFLLRLGMANLQDVTTETIEAFLISRPRRSARSFNHLLGVVRRLFDWHVAQGAFDRSPVTIRPRREVATRIPFLFDASHARRLLDLAGTLADGPNAPLRGPTYRTIFALLYGLGLRIGEVSRLCLGDTDMDRCVLVIRQTKFSKTRLVPFGPRIAELLTGYLRLRPRGAGGTSPESPLFSFIKGQVVAPGSIRNTFHGLVKQLQLTIPVGTATPRVHDLRHSFAVGTLLRWYRTGAQPAALLLRLSTFLGHVDPASTAVYLTITADLLSEASGRFETFAAPAALRAEP